MKKTTRLDDVDVVFDPKPLTEAEKNLISEYIRQDKAKRKKKKRTQARTNIKRPEKILT